MYFYRVKLSVIIVNYNVRAFLEQCLHSVKKALAQIPSEVIVVDNHSVDGSVAMIREKFPWVRLITNHENRGFSKANNQALQVASGDYILLLNPDTLVQEDTFVHCLSFMESHPQAGAMGVKMISGKGKVLPESKRALPTPRIAFYKISGLARLFPRSATFNRYYLGHLDGGQTQEIEVLTGAFMFLRKEALQKTGLLDEAYFMYGEDIDLSYRLTRNGYKIYYSPGTSIIHFKGQSTRKSSMNYVILFYRAMLVFTAKYFSSGRQRFFSLFLHLAIYIRALASVIKRLLQKILLPLTDALIIYAGFFWIRHFWEQVRFEEGIRYPAEYMGVVVPVYILVWIASIFFHGGYDRPYKPQPHYTGILTGTILILLVYSLLPIHLRYSRAMILLGSAWIFVINPFVRRLLLAALYPGRGLWRGWRRNFIIVGSAAECRRIHDLLKTSGFHAEPVGWVAPSEASNMDIFLGPVEQLVEIIRVNAVDYIIFSSADVPIHQIISCMNKSATLGVEFRIAPPESLSVIGTTASHAVGDLYLIPLSPLSEPRNRRNKRALDFIVSLGMILLSPLLLVLYKKPGKFYSNLFSILAGKKTLVGYYPTREPLHDTLPALKPGVLHPLDMHGGIELNDHVIEQANLSYAKEYRLINDFRIWMQGFKNLDK
jgi:GT2 family glycosyltransferase